MAEAAEAPVVICIGSDQFRSHTGKAWRLVSSGAIIRVSDLRSGDMLAETLMRACDHSLYVRRVREELASELARAARLKAGFFRPAFLGLLLHALGQSTAVRRVVADLIAGRQSYATLKWRLIKTLEVGLARRALTA